MHERGNWKGVRDMHRGIEVWEGDVARNELFSGGIGSAEEWQRSRAPNWERMSWEELLTRGRVGCMKGMGWVVGSRGAKVLGKHQVSPGAMGERSAPRCHDWCIEERGRGRVGCVPRGRVFS